MYNIGSAFHTDSLLLHFPPLRSALDFSTPAFSVPPPVTLQLDRAVAIRVTKRKNIKTSAIPSG